MHGDAEDEAHGGQDHGKFEESDAEIGKQFAKQKAHRANRSDEKLFEGATFFFADDGKRGEERGHVEKEDRSQSGQKEVRGTGVRIEKNFGAHVHGKSGIAGEDPAERLIEANRGGNIDRLAGHGGVGAIDQNEDLGVHLMEEFVGIIDRDFDAHAAFAGDDGVIQIAIIAHIANEVEGVGILEAVKKLPAFAAVVGVEDHGVDLADVGVNAVAQKKHLQNRG